MDEYYAARAFIREESEPQDTYKGRVDARRAAYQSAHSSREGLRALGEAVFSFEPQTFGERADMQEFRWFAPIPAPSQWERMMSADELLLLCQSENDEFIRRVDVGLPRTKLEYTDTSPVPTQR
jgi:hypothetical protein